MRFTTKIHHLGSSSIILRTLVCKALCDDCTTTACIEIRFFQLSTPAQNRVKKSFLEIFFQKGFSKIKSARSVKKNLFNQKNLLESKKDFSESKYHAWWKNTCIPQKIIYLFAILGLRRLFSPFGGSAARIFQLWPGIAKGFWNRFPFQPDPTVKKSFSESKRFF